MSEETLIIRAENVRIDKGTCEWDCTPEISMVYKTECGWDETFPIEGIEMSDNIIKYCPFCGGPPAPTRSCPVLYTSHTKAPCACSFYSLCASSYRSPYPMNSSCSAAYR